MAETRVHQAGTYPLLKYTSHRCYSKIPYTKCGFPIHCIQNPVFPRVSHGTRSILRSYSCVHVIIVLHTQHRGPSISCYTGVFFFLGGIFVIRKWSPRPKNDLERRVSQFYTICDGDQLLNKNIGKVMAILVLRYQKLGHSMHHRDPSCPVGL
jgi:hypothetical protein